MISWSADFKFALTFFVIFISHLLHVTLADGNFQFLHQRQESFVKRLDSYDIIIPKRVTRDGEFLSHKLYPHKNRIKRSEPSSDYTLYYQLNIQNRNVHLKLKPNVNLYNPLLVIERRTSAYNNVSDSNFTRYSRNGRHCHYTGVIQDKSTSKIALEVCSGLHGLIHTGETAYFIEPLKNNDSTSNGHPHVIYEHTSENSFLSPGQSSTTRTEDSCGNDEMKAEEAEKRRDRWESRHNPNTRKHHRHKRSISVEHHVETLVVVDPDMMKFYKNEDITTYVLTVMNMVSTLFHDASLGNAVNIVVVRLILLEKPQKNLKITHHADKTLRSFCKWQTKINIKDEDHPNHHDVAILLTRKDICARMNRPCNTLGLAHTSGICQPHRSCSVSEDTGLALAYTVAHELGHNFGMRHDGRSNECRPSNRDHYLYLMQSQLFAVSPLMKWSNCSKRAITKFIDRGWAFCIEDEPAKYRDTTYEYPMLPPGIMYDVEHQCRLAYGPNATFCGGQEDVCNTLWCRVNNKCSTRLEAAAEGTLCGQNKWCFNEQCVEIGERPQSINGNWGEWSGWSQCSRTCGAGVSSVERHCDNPRPANGGKFCIGERKRYKICNTEPCDEEALNFHEVQCNEFDYIPYKNGLYEWQHVPTPRTPCQLHCKPKNKFFSVRLRDMVTDGTPCTPGTRNMCISGRCRHIGCDWKIDSSAREDRCGVCHGDGSTCETIKDQYNETQGMGYVEATVIPKDARNIIVEEVAAADNYLALQNDKGEYYLNGHWFIQWSGDYNIAGTIVHYDRKGGREMFRAVGPLKESLHIMLLLQDHNPGVSFEYTVPRVNATATRQRNFVWKYMDWTHCTSSCGSGTQRSEVVCLEKEAGIVDDYYCNGTVKPDDRQRSCNDHLCPARWWSGPWQHCSVTCGENGIHRRTVICVRSLGNDEQIALDDRSCEGQAKPTEVEKCHHKDPCPGTAKWKTSEWTNCTDNLCALQTRFISCSSPVIGCEKSLRPHTTRSCSNVTCVNWLIGHWTECSSTCGYGIRVRNVTCPFGKICDKTKKPISEDACDISPCPITTTVKTTPNLIDIKEETGESLFERDEFIKNEKRLKEYVTYKISESQTTSVPESNTQLESGQTKFVNIADPVSKLLEIQEGGYESKNKINNPVQVNIVLDKADSNSPHVTKNNNVESTTLTQTTVVKHIKVLHQKSNIYPKDLGTKPHRHRHGHSRHKVPRGGITNKHLPSDRNVLLPSLPDIAKLRPLPKLPTMPKTIKTQPRIRIPSNRIFIPSVFEWSPNNWTECSRKCDGGIQTRSVSCVDSKTRKEAPVHKCNILTKMNAIRVCNTQKCQSWISSPWSQCSATCGAAVKSRKVQCPDNSFCDPEKKPISQQDCHLPACVAWIHGQWSTCTKTCNKGEQIRLVQCVNLTSELLASGCDPEQKPTEKQMCNADPCPEEPKSELTKPTCKRNRMNNRICRKLQQRRLCNRLFVRVNCCRSCEFDRYMRRGRPRRRQER